MPDQIILGLLKSKPDLEFINVKCGDSWTNLTSIDLSLFNEITMAELKETRKTCLL